MDWKGLGKEKETVRLNSKLGHLRAIKYRFRDIQEKDESLTCSWSGHLSVVTAPEEYTEADDATTKKSSLQRETDIGEWFSQWHNTAEPEEALRCLHEEH
jgi:hypothetical protein